MPDHVVVIGGGLAGLRAAVSLADAGRRVTVLESRATLGGRARSFTDPATAEVVDNGQHLFIGGYHRTLAFLDRLGTRDRLLFQKRLRVSFIRPGGAVSTLDCPPLPPPWHLIAGLLGLRGIPWRDKLRLPALWADVRSASATHRRPETADGWLARLGQGRESRELFWGPLIIAALNEQPERASAEGLKQVLSRMMGEPSSSARLGMATVGLTDLYAEPARRIIERGGGRVLVNRPVVSLEIEGRRARAVRLADGSRLEADAVVASVPPASLLKLLPESAPGCGELRLSLARFGSSSILSVNLWLERPLTDHLFAALLGCRFQWLFNKRAILNRAGIEAGYVSLILSAADDLLDRPNPALVRMALEDLKACFPSAGSLEPTRTQVVREREATVSLTPETEPLRPGPRTPLENFFLAGDWTATALPATLESAVVSGESAAKLVTNKSTYNP